MLARFATCIAPIRVPLVSVRSMSVSARIEHKVIEPEQQTLSTEIDAVDLVKFNQNTAKMEKLVHLLEGMKLHQRRPVEDYIRVMYSATVATCMVILVGNWVIKQ
jgi:hypothetical protein